MQFIKRLFEKRNAKQRLLERKEFGMDNAIILRSIDEVIWLAETETSDPKWVTIYNKNLELANLSKLSFKFRPHHSKELRSRIVALTNDINQLVCYIQVKRHLLMSKNFDNN